MLKRKVLIQTVCAVAVAAGLYQVTAGAEPTEPTPGVLLETDVEYGTGGGEPLHMDIARPKTGDGPFPAVLFIHGGGWQRGDKSMYRAAIQNYAKLGYVAASVQYRFAPTHRWPAQIEDCKCAVRYLRSRAKELNIDPDRIGATGASAGGHLALMLATTPGDKALEGTGGHGKFSSKVSAVISVAGPTDFTQTFPAASHYLLKDLIGDDDPEHYKGASPLHRVSKGDAPLMCIHGTKDELVPYEQATSLIEACKKGGVEATLMTITDGGHNGGGSPADFQAAIVKGMEFFGKHLGKKK